MLYCLLFCGHHGLFARPSAPDACGRLSHQPTARKFTQRETGCASGGAVRGHHTQSQGRAYLSFARPGAGLSFFLLPWWWSYSCAPAPAPASAAPPTHRVALPGPKPTWQTLPVETRTPKLGTGIGWWNSMGGGPAVDADLCRTPSLTCLLRVFVPLLTLETVLALRSRSVTVFGRGSTVFASCPHTPPQLFLPSTPCCSVRSLACAGRSLLPFLVLHFAWGPRFWHMQLAKLAMWTASRYGVRVQSPRRFDSGMPAKTSVYDVSLAATNLAILQRCCDRYGTA